MAGVSKQACQQYHKRRLQRQQQGLKFFEQADQIRAAHPGCGCRKMALDLRVPGWGRDKMESLLLGSGYRLYHPPNYRRTTYSQRKLIFPNLIEGLELTGINQLVQTDITYYWTGTRHFYLVFLIDVYSRRIVGYSINKTLQAKGNIKALNKLLTLRRDQELKGMIHHSDRGTQYIDTEYLRLLQDRQIQVSMSKEAWQNAYTERINRTIKEEYLDHWKISSYQDLVAGTHKAVSHYNNVRKHDALESSPIAYEKHVAKLDPGNRPTFRLYKPTDSSHIKNDE